MQGTRKMSRAAIYSRVSTLDQEPENQLAELRPYARARSWTTHEYVGHGVSGAKDRRPALDSRIRDAKLRRFSVLVVWRPFCVSALTWLTFSFNAGSTAFSSDDLPTPLCPTNTAVRPARSLRRSSSPRPPTVRSSSSPTRTSAPG